MHTQPILQFARLRFDALCLAVQFLISRCVERLVRVESPTQVVQDLQLPLIDREGQVLARRLLAIACPGCRPRWSASPGVPNLA